MCNNFRCSTHLCMSLSIHLCVCASGAYHISWTIHHLIIMFGTHVGNDDISRCFFLFFYLFFFRFWFFGLLLGWKGKKQPKMKNNSYIHLEPYLTKSVAYDHDFWYTCAYFPPRWWVWVCGWVYVCVQRRGAEPFFRTFI